MAEAESLVGAKSQAAAVGSASAATGCESSTDTNSGLHVKIVARGYLLKKCRINGDNKPWKKRYFVLHGASLLYYRGENIAGAHKVLTVLSPDCSIRQGSAPPWNAKDSLPIAIVDRTGKTINIAATDKQTFEYWRTALLQARELPPAELPDQEYKYLDAPTKELIRALLEHAQTQAGKKIAKSHEKGIFDIMARIAVIYHAGRLPPNLDLSLLHDETTNFCQDFLMYSRDQRLKDVRGPDAEIQPLNMPELLRSIGVVQEMWQDILHPHVSAKVLTNFQSITSFYTNEEQDSRNFDTMCTIEKNLRTILESY